MDAIKLNLGAINGEITITVIKKDVKNVSLKVYRDLTVKVTAPKVVTDDWLDKFVISKKDWINKQLSKFKQSNGYNANTNIKSGTSTQYLGKDLRIYKMPSLKNEIVLEEKSLTIFLKNINDEDKCSTIFDDFWREKCRKIFGEQTQVFYEKIFKKHGVNQPTIHIRKMKTMWGSCNKSKSKITYNQYLLKADIRCIQYVVLHELSHLLYPYHNKDFYNFLTIHMPDWNERKKQLDMETVQGL